MFRISVTAAASGADLVALNTTRMFTLFTHEPQLCLASKAVSFFVALNAVCLAFSCMLMPFCIGLFTMRSGREVSF